MLLSETERPVGNDATVIFDGKDGVVESVDLDKVACNEVLVGVFLLCVLERVSFLLLLDNLDLLFLDLLDDLFKDEVRVAGEEARQTVVFVAVLRVQLGEGLEFEVGRGGVVETLGGELVLAVVSESHRDVVISVQTRNTTPEQEFLKVVRGCLIEERSESHFELELLFDVEAEAVVCQVA